jgi:Pyruvate/2-oxoacid:ferredoxin oxidoreductase delta subunit
MLPIRRIVKKAPGWGWKFEEIYMSFRINCLLRWLYCLEGNVYLHRHYRC